MNTPKKDQQEKKQFAPPPPARRRPDVEDSPAENSGTKLEKLQEDLEQMKSTIERQRRLLLEKSKETLIDTPYATAMSDEEIDLVEKRNLLIDLHKKKGLLESEYHELLRIDASLDRLRRTNAPNVMNPTMQEDRRLAKSVDERKRLEIQPKPGYRYRWVNDSEDLHGRKLRIAYEAGLRFVKKGHFDPSKPLVEADGDLNFPSSMGDVENRYVGNNQYGHPVTAYLMYEPQEIYQERQRLKFIENEEIRRSKLEESVDGVAVDAPMGIQAEKYGYVRIRH